MWHDKLKSDIDSHLGATPKRLLVAVLDCAKNAKSSNSPILVSKAEIVANLERSKKPVPNSQTMRKQVQQINQSARDMALEFPLVSEPIELRSRGEIIELRLSSEYAQLCERESAREQLARSTEQDTIIDRDTLEPPHISEAIPVFQVFVSHAHEDEEVEEIVSEFYHKLKQKLEDVPHEYTDRFRVKLWIDRFDMKGRRSFADQTDFECSRSAAGLFLLSDRWYRSSACKREARYFQSTDSSLGSKFFRVQLSGNRLDGDPDYTDGPCYPECSDSSVGNLLLLWERGTAAKDEVLTKLRNDICQDISRRLDSNDQTLISVNQSSETATGPNVVRHFQSTNIRGGVWEQVRLALRRSYERDQREQAILDGETEDPFLSTEEGADGTLEALPLLEDWALNLESPNRIYALLGSFGSGKTTTSQLFAMALMEKHNLDPSSPYPIYLDFRRLIDWYETAKSRQLSLVEIIRISLHSSVRDTVDAEQVLNLLRKDACIIIFDGLDEIGTRIGTDRTANLYKQLLEIIPTEARIEDRRLGRADWDMCPARILVTCRTHFFRDHIQEKNLLTGHDRSTGFQERLGFCPVKTIYMAPFTPSQIRSFFQRTLGETKGTEVFNSVSRIPDLSGLAKQPIMARYIAELSPELQSDASKGLVINAARVYGHLFRRALERDADKRPLLTPVDRQALLEELAFKLWRSQSREIEADELERWFDEYASTQSGIRMIMTSDLSARHLLQTELRNASLLVRANNSEFRFVHTSFFDFFLAKRLLKLLLAENDSFVDDSFYVSREVVEFMLDLVALDGSWANLRKACDKALSATSRPRFKPFILSLRAALLERDQWTPLPVGADLSSVDLSNVRWQSIRERRSFFSGVSFEEANLMSASFKYIDFLECNFSGTVLGNVSFDQCTFQNCIGTPWGIESVKMHGCNYDDKSSAALNLERSIRFDKVDGEIVEFEKNAGIIFDIAQGEGDAKFSVDDSRILTCAFGEPAFVWDTASGERIQTSDASAENIVCCDFLPDGNSVIFATIEGTVGIWNLQPNEYDNVQSSNGTGFYSVGCSMDGTTLFGIGTDSSLHFWDAVSKQVLKTLDWSAMDIEHIALSADLSHAAGLVQSSSHGENREVCILCTEKDVVVASVLVEDSDVSAVTISRDGRSAAYGTNNGGVGVVNVSNSVENEYLTFGEVNQTVEALVFSGDGNRLAVAYNEGKIVIWDLKQKEIVSEFNQSWSQSVAFSSEGSALLVGSRYASAMLYDSASGTPFMNLYSNRSNLSISKSDPEGKTITTASREGFIGIWDLESGEQIRSIEAFDTPITACEVSSDANKILVGGLDNEAKLIDVQSGVCTAHLRGHTDRITSVAIGNSNKLLLTGSNDGSACLWDADTGTIKRELIGHTHAISSVACAPDETSVMTSSYDKTICVWAPDTGEQIMRVEDMESRVFDLSYSPNGKLALAVQEDGSLIVWNPLSKDLSLLINEGLDFCKHAVFSSDGSKIYSVSGDGFVKVLATASGAILDTMSLGIRGIRGFSMFSSDKMVIASCADGVARVLDFETGNIIKGLIPLSGSWASADGNGFVRKCSNNAWKSLQTQNKSSKRGLLSSNEFWPRNS